MFKHAGQIGFEGVVGKRAESPYKRPQQGLAQN
jgi:ATP-dependent DNA ligase